jgi:dTDP-4-amino-4,6-dideoxygalactose transaminase
VADRDVVKKKLQDAGVGSAIYYPLSLHLQTCFKDLGGKEGDFPASEQASREVLALPIYPELPEEQVKYVATTLRSIAG